MVTNANPLLSIIIATYNASSTLERSLNSVVSLDYNDWECLIIDGDSKDDTINIVRKFENKDRRFRHISEKDNGLYDAFNKGWKNAKGDWVYYLGADDELTSNGLGLLMQQAFTVESNIAIVSGGVVRVRQDNSKRILMSKGFVGSHQSMIMRRSVLDEMHGFNYKCYSILADYDLFIRIKNNKYKAKNCEAIVAYFHAGGTSEKLRNIKKIMCEKYNILRNDRYCKFPLGITLKDSFKTFLGGVYHKTSRKIKNLFQLKY